jgi:hypothetical protein
MLSIDSFKAAGLSIASAALFDQVAAVLFRV